MTQHDAMYIRAFMRAEAACLEWKRSNPDARLKFRPIPVPERGGLIASLELVLEMGVAGNSVTRKLLTAIKRSVADGGGATVMMAEYALERVYGLKHALTRATSN